MVLNVDHRSYLNTPGWYWGMVRSFWGRQDWMLYSDEPLQLEGRIIGLNV